MDYPNIPLLHRARCDCLGPRTALRYKRYGLYHDLSWSRYRRQADGAAAGLIELGVEPGDRVALFSENRYEWMIADQAILSTGAINVPLHAPLAPGQVGYQVGHSESRGIIVSDQTQADKVFDVLSDLPKLEFLICFEPIEAPASLRTLTWQGLIHRGRQCGAVGFDEVQRREAAIGGDNLATIIYTSGTTGDPKGVMLTHSNLLSNAEATCAISNIESADILLSWLPYSHIYARTVDIYLTIIAGVTVALAESIETLLTNLAEVQPTWLTAVPRFYEKVWAEVEKLSPEKQRKELRRMFGPRLKQLTSGGAPLPRQICEGFFQARIPLLEGYGLTESSPVISFNSSDCYRIGTVGRPISGVEVKIADDGEILTRGPHVMKGYWKNLEATAEAIVDGWLSTGDVGELDDDGFLTITDRKKDLFVTSAGKNVAPAELERLLTSDPYIDQVVVYGDGRQFISALIVPNFESLAAHVQRWVPVPACPALFQARLGARADGRVGRDSRPPMPPAETDDEFIRDPAILAFVGERIEAAMQQVSRPERVKKFLLLARPFRLESDELTATLKVRRRLIIEKYESQLAALYDE